MDIFELFDKELECGMAYVESELANAKYVLLADPETFMEAGASGNIFQKLLTKVKEIVEKAINTIKQFFASKQVESSLKSAEAAAKENPAVLKEKVKVKDYAKLEKLHKKTEAELKKCKTDAQVNDTMNKYRKQRNLILGAGAVAAVTLGAIFLYTKKKGKEAEVELNKALSEAETHLTAIREKELDTKKHDLYDRLENEKRKNDRDARWVREDLKTREGCDKLVHYMASKQCEHDVCKAQVELLRDAASDSVARNKEFAAKWMRVGAADIIKKNKIAQESLNAVRNSGDAESIAAYIAKTRDAVHASIKFDKRVDSELRSKHRDYDRARKRLKDLERYQVNPKLMEEQNIRRSDLEKDLVEARNEVLELWRKYKPF